MGLSPSQWASYARLKMPLTHVLLAVTAFGLVALTTLLTLFLAGAAMNNLYVTFRQIDSRGRFMLAGTSLGCLVLFTMP